MTLAFGPVPSRRFGRSLGVNNIPPKHCSYACQYCQLGPTEGVTLRRRPFHLVRDLVRSVEQRVAVCRDRGERIDYLTFVPDGEPTLDALLGEEIRSLRSLGIPVAVITNASLLWRPEVREDLAEADVVSVKIDTADPRTWRRLNRPAPPLALPTVLQGLTRFAWDFPGETWTETMLVAGINDDLEGLALLGSVLERIDPARAYLAVPTRPPAVPSVAPPPEEAVLVAYELLREHVARLELLAHPEEGPFGVGGDPVEDLMGILAVHPMREEGARAYLEGSGADPAVLDHLLTKGWVARVRYDGKGFVVRRFEYHAGTGPWT